MCSAALTCAWLSLGAGCSVDVSGTASDEPFDEAGSPVADSFGAPLDTATARDSTLPVDAELLDTASPPDGTPPPDTTPPPDGMPPPDTTPPPDSTPPPPDTTPPPPDGSTCDLSACGGAPGTAKLAALVDATIACPAGFKSTDVVEAMSGDGCGCACTLSAGTCPSNAAVSTTFSDDGSCGNNGDVLTTGGCKALATGVGFAGTHFGASVPPPGGVACAAVRTTNKAVQTRTLHLCVPNTGTCFAAVCAAPFAECIEVAGACPSGYPTSRKVGSDLSITCAACTCATTTGKCGGTIEFASNSTCGGTKVSFPVDGGCSSVPGGTGTVRSFTYTPSGPTGSGCAPSFTAAPGTTTLGGPRSFCCR